MENGKPCHILFISSLNPTTYKLIEKKKKTKNIHFDMGNYIATGICFSYMRTSTHTEEFNTGCNYNVVMYL